MGCVPTDLFELASRLAQEDACEAQRRCSVSRAYYAALHSVDSLFPKQATDVRIDGESSHAEIIGRVMRYGAGLNPGRTNAAFIAKQLPRLRRERNAADYHLDKALGHAEVADVIARVRAVLNSCGEVARLRDAAERDRG